MDSLEFIQQINEISRGFHIIYGPKFGGKSSVLIATYWNDKKRNRNPIAFNYSADNRYSENYISSHNLNLSEEQRSCPAHQVNSVNQIVELLIGEQHKHNERPNTILIDKVNLFDEDILEFCQGKRDSGTKIIVAGLRLSSRMEPFPFRKYHAIKEICPQEHHFSNRTMVDLIKLADFEYLLRESQCSNILGGINGQMKCNNLASFTQKFNKNGTIADYNSPLIHMGASKDLNSEPDYYYESRCISCFIKPK